ncbi:MAG TPA: thioredoxin [Vicinamibacterales bacterium]|nr:thioredoxin [Vicinamibacterales bacterium]
MSSISIDDRGVVMACRSCGQRNRVPFNRLTAETRCGKCHTPITAPDEPIEVPSASAFDALVAGSPLPVVVDFWAPWCGPCRMVAPEIARVASRNAGRFLVVKVNTDVLTDLGERFGIRSIPTMAVFAGGREVARTAGARPAADIEAFVQGAIPVTSRQ